MKKLVFILMMISVAVNAQVTENVSIWNKVTPEYKNYIDAENIVLSSYGQYDFSEGWAGNNGAFIFTNLHVGQTNGQINYSKYIEFKIKSKEDKFIKLNHFTFHYITGDNYNQSVSKGQLRFSKNNFANGSTGELLSDINFQSGSSYKKVQANFPANAYLEQYETLTVRLYLYAPTNTGYTKFFIAKFIQDQHLSGPTINATVSTLSGTSDEVLVRYINPNGVPSNLHANVSGTQIATSGTITRTDGNGWNTPYYHIKGWSANNTNKNNYAKIVIKSTGGTVKNAVLKLPYRVTNADVLTVQYSKDFATGLIYTNTYQLNTGDNWNEITINFDKAKAINAGQELEVRFMLQNPNGTNSNGMFIRYKFDTQDGMHLYGAYEGTSSASACVVTTVWNGSTWSMGTPAFNKKAVLEADYDMNAYPNISTINACELEIVAGKKLTIAPNKIFVVKNNITVHNNAQLTVQDKGSLVQVNENATYTGAPESFNMFRNTTKIHRFDYVYWSSPVKEDANVFLLGKNPQNTNIKGLTPLTYFNKFHEWNPNTGWVNINYGNTAMKAGKGYIARAPQTAEFGLEPTDSTSYKIFEAKFIGIPNNGTITVDIAGNKWNLVGNPYASAISLEEFFEFNKELIDATAYIWTHDTPATANTEASSFNYSNTDYIAANLVGTIDVKKRRNTNGEYIALDIETIAAGQSFLVKAKNNIPAGSQLVFNNAMRVTQSAKNNNFFRPGNTNESVENWDETGKHRLWISISNTRNEFNQAIVGYIQNATNNIDSRYDAVVNNSKPLSIFSIEEDTNLSIQARALPFIESDLVPLGYKSAVAGEVTIELDNYDGLFSGRIVYLEDKVLNVLHNIKNGAYTFQTQAGTFEDRFVIRYTEPETLSTQQPIATVSEMIVYKSNNQIGAKLNNENIKEITVFDLQGKTLYSNNKVNSNQIVTNNLTANNQMVIVRVVTENNVVKTQKVIL